MHTNALVQVHGHEWVVAPNCNPADYRISSNSACSWLPQELLPTTPLSEYENPSTWPLYEHDLIRAIETQGIRLVLAASPNVDRLAHFGQTVQAINGWEQAFIGTQLSAWLLEKQTPYSLRLLRQGLHECLSASNRPLICLEIDILFEPVLHLDPLALFVQMSRQRPLVVLWPGNVGNSRLTYAVPEHAHYRTWNRPTAPEVRIFAVPS